MDNQKQFLQQALLNNGLHFSSALQDQLLHFLNLLKQWNRVFNFTAIHDPQDMVMLHILDSLSITPLFAWRLFD